MRFAAFIVTLLLALPASAWWDTDFLNRKEITLVDAEIIGGAHTDFPVLIARTDTDFSAARSDGFDIAFVNGDDTTQLDHELEEWVDGTGELVAWVRVPSLPTGSDDTIYVYYNKAAQATTMEDIVGTWNGDVDYRGVWHLNDDFLDSTDNSNDGTNNGSTDFTTGFIADSQDFDGINDYINNGNDTSLQITSSITVGCWAALQSTPVASDALFSKQNNQANNESWQIDVLPSRIPRFFKVAGTDFDIANCTTAMPTDGTWIYLVGTFDDTPNTSRCYYNGSQEGSVTGVGAINAGAWRVQIGAQGVSGSPGRFADARIDECRVAVGARSTNWIDTEHNNQSAPATFATFGAEEDAPSGARRVIIIGKRLFRYLSSWF